MSTYNITHTPTGNTFAVTVQPVVINHTVNVVATVAGEGGSGITDGDKGDITVSGTGAVWTIDARAVTVGKLFEVGATKLLGRHSGTAGDCQEVSVDGGLEFHGGQLRRAALTGDVTASAGDGATTIASGVVSTSKMGGDVTTAGKALLDDADAATQRTTLGLGNSATRNVGSTSGTVCTGDDVRLSDARTPLSHTHPLSELTQSGATTGQVAQWNGANWVPATVTSGIGGTLGTTDNALTRADGTGGSTAQGSGVTLDDSANLSATNWTVGSGSYSTRTFSKFCSVGTNIAVVIGPTGTGFISSQTPDGANAGGNLRGDNAVDFSYSRTAATRVASGTGSFNGGIESTASGANSFSFNGTASGSRSVAIGGSAANATATSAIAIGPSMTASAQSSAAVGGEANSATATYASSFGGYGNTASGQFSFASGYYATASLYGQWSHASGRFAASGDCQSSRMEMRRATTDATPSNLFLDGSSARLVVPANSSGCAMISVTARTATAGAETMTWRRRVNWQRGVAVGTVTVDVETVGTDRGYTGGAWGVGPAWSLSITADTTNGAINVIGTGAAATNIRWAASVEWIETAFA